MPAPPFLLANIRRLHLATPRHQSVVRLQGGMWLWAERRASLVRMFLEHPSVPTQGAASGDWADARIFAPDFLLLLIPLSFPRPITAQHARFLLLSKSSLSPSQGPCWQMGFGKESQLTNEERSKAHLPSRLCSTVRRPSYIWGPFRSCCCLDSHTLLQCPSSPRPSVPDIESVAPNPSE